MFGQSLSLHLFRKEWLGLKAQRSFLVYIPGCKMDHCTLSQHRASESETKLIWNENKLLFRDSWRTKMPASMNEVRLAQILSIIFLPLLWKNCPCLRPLIMEENKIQLKINSLAEVEIGERKDIVTIRYWNHFQSVNLWFSTSLFYFSYSKFVTIKMSLISRDIHHSGMLNHLNLQLLYISSSISRVLLMVMSVDKFLAYKSEIHSKKWNSLWYSSAFQICFKKIT